MRAIKASRLGLKEIVIHFGMFDFKAICVVGPYEAALKFAAWKHEWPKEWDVQVVSSEMNKGYEPRGRIFRRPGYVPVIWIPHRPRTPREYGTLAHEVLHAVRLLMDWAAIELNAETEEAYCHALGHGVTTILDALKVK